MAEKHKLYSPAGTLYWKDFLYSIWDFVQNQQSGIVQFVDDGGTKSVYLGASFWDGSAVLTNASFSNNSYIVIEPVTAYPGGGKWQAKFTSPNVSSGTTGNMSLKTSFSGGWDSTTNVDFGAVTTAVTGAEPITSQTMAAGDSYYLSCANTDSYTNTSGTQTYTYLRFLMFDASIAENSKFQGAYVGGYTPIEVDNDTKPCVMATRTVGVVSASTSWGYRHASSNCAWVPGDFAHTGGGGVNSAFVGTGATTNDPYFGNSRGGSWANGATLVSDNDGNVTLGAFGKFTMMNGDIDRADGAADASAEYVVASSAMLRWKV